MKKIFSLLIAFVLIFPGGLLNAQEEINDNFVPAGRLQAWNANNEDVGEFPLKHTEVKAEVSGYLSRVEVIQEFTNPYNEPIEAVYVFPMPDRAAIDEMEMQIGARVIKGLMKGRDEARQIYNQAKLDGKRASLLEQERANIFTQSVANILPGNTIIIKISYIEVLDYDNGKYTFVFPMVVGPRYNPASVKDSVKITPPIARSGHDISLEVNLYTANIPFQNLKSKQHEVSIAKKSEVAAVITLSSEDSIPNKDFILEYEVAGDLPEFAVLSNNSDGDDGFFTLMVQPPVVSEKLAYLPKEMIFIMDTSGSMRGNPIEISKETMNYSLDNLNPGDTFNIYQFDSRVELFSEKPILSTDENIKKAKSYINNLQASGGTEMMTATRKVFSQPLQEGRLRIISLMSDGLIGNDDEIIKEIKEKIGNDTRLFGFAIGSSPNRYLFNKMDEVGRGVSYYANMGANPEEIVDKFYDRIDSPVLTGINIDWKGLDVYDLYPQAIPDLFDGEPFYVHGRYKKGGKADIEISGRMADEKPADDAWDKIFNSGEPIKASVNSFSVSVDLPVDNKHNTGLKSVWARSKIDDLMDSMYHKFEGANDKIAEITKLGIDYHVMTQYTSFVAVDDSVVTESGQNPKRVDVPVSLPAGMKAQNNNSHNTVRSGMPMTEAVESTGRSSGGYNTLSDSFGALNLGLTHASNSSLGNVDPRDMSIRIANIVAIFFSFVVLIIFVVGAANLVVGLKKKVSSKAEQSEEDKIKVVEKVALIAGGKKLIILSIKMIIIGCIVYGVALFVLNQQYLGAIPS